MIEYTVRQTRRGDWIVKMSHNNREVGRASTEAEANEIASRLRQNDAERSKSDTARIAADNQYATDTPDLTQMQLRWQNWRNWYYNELVNEERRVSASRRAIDRADTSARSYPKHEQDVCEDEQTIYKARQLYETVIIPLDGTIKAARRSRDTDALAGALAESEPLIDKMRATFWSRAGIIDEYKPIPHQSGTPPNAHLCLTDAEIEYCEHNGGKSAAIHHLLATAMERDHR
jgi:hypothetical protein